MKNVRYLICCLVVLVAVLVTLSSAKAAIWDISNYNDGIIIDDSGISTATKYPYGITDWFIRYDARVTNIYTPMFREWFWYRIGTTGKQTSFDKLPVTGAYNFDSSAVTLTYVDTQSRFKAIVTFQIIGKPEYNYNSTFIKNITIQNTGQSELDFHLYSYNDLDMSVAGTDNIAIVKDSRAIQTSMDGRTLIQTSTLKPSHFDIDTLGSSPGSSLDSLENGTDPLVLSDFSGPFPENGDIQFVFQYDLSIPAGGSVSFAITDKVMQTNPLVISNSQTGGSCANYNGNTTYNICFNNTTNTVAANNVVVTADFKIDGSDPSGTFSFISATDGGVYDPLTKSIGWSFPSVSAGAQQCVQATMGVNTTKAFSAGATIYSDETFPAQVSALTPLCNYPPSVTSVAPNKAYTGIQYAYQVTASDVENDPLTITLAQAPPGMSIDASKRITWTPTSQQGNASYPVGVDISDGHSVIHHDFSIFVQWQNQAPSAPAEQTADASANKPLTYQILAADPDNQVLSFKTMDNLPAGLTLSSSGLLSGTPTAIGTSTVNVTIADPLQATVSTKLVINVTAVAPPQTPTIIWGTPAAITYGTALSVTQLNATASVPGTFVYTPAAGTILSAGSQALSVTFTPTDTTAYNTATASVNLTVNKASATVTLSGLSKTYDGTAKAATATTNPTGKTVTFTYNGSSTAPIAAGSYTVIGTINDSNYSGSATGTMTIAKATPAITWAAPAAVNLGTVLSASQLNATASVPGSFTYTPAAGTALNIAGAQTLTAAFTPTDTANYANATASVSITVNGKQTPTITWGTPAAINYGTALSVTQLNATASVPGTFAYAPAAGTVLNAGIQALSVTFAPTDTTAYNTATASVNLTVNKAAATVTLSGLSKIYDGTAKAATATTNPTGKTVTFTYNGSSTAPIAAGSYTVIGTINDSNYSGSATGTMTIAKATPAITWATPAAVNIGTALSATQLNATASVPGSFTYTPAVGTAMTTVGAQTLTAAFTPTDTANYANATASVSITVNSAIQPPTVAVIPDATITAPVPFSYVLKASDPQGQTMSYSLSSTPAATGLAINSTTGVINWSESAAGSYTITVTATNTSGLKASQSFILTVNATANLAPKITSVPVTTATTGETYNYQVNAYDPNGDVLTYSLRNAPSGMTISSNGLISWTPKAQHFRNYRSDSSRIKKYLVTIRVMDSTGQFATQSFTVSVSSARSLRADNRHLSYGRFSGDKLFLKEEE